MGANTKSLPFRVKFNSGRLLFLTIPYIWDQYVYFLPGSACKLFRDLYPLIWTILPIVSVGNWEYWQSLLDFCNLSSVCWYGILPWGSTLWLAQFGGQQYQYPPWKVSVFHSFRLFFRAHSAFLKSLFFQLKIFHQSLWALTITQMIIGSQIL